MAKVLGLSFHYHDSAAALVIDSGVIAAVAEERFSRKKHAADFPERAIEYCLEAGNLGSINELDAIVFYEKPVVKFSRLLEMSVKAWPRGLSQFAGNFPDYLKNKLNVYGLIAKKLPGYRGEILFSQHHLSHAASAFYPSPFEKSAILTLDGVGEWETATVGVGSGNDIELVKSIHFPHSVGLLYAALTGYLGFEVNEGEWKTMGLAAYGQPKYAEKFRELVQLMSDGSFALNLNYFRHQFSSKEIFVEKKWHKLFGFAPRASEGELQQQYADLASSGQLVIEEMILALAREAAKISGSRNLVLAGGVGLNGLANARIEKEKIFDHVWIPPAPGDDGGALGAALLVAHQHFGAKRSQEPETAFLGPEFNSSEIEDFLKAKNIKYSKAHMEDTAELLAQGKVIGWFQGRMEFGPRALGARSILADPRNPQMKEILNKKIKFRESFRPFAPVVPLEFAAEYFEVESNMRFPFMSKVIKVKSENIPAVTHKDFTARLQTVERTTQPLLYDLLLKFQELTKVPVLLNTSFNVRGEPIACTPEDAYGCFLETGMDALVLGEFLITEKTNLVSDKGVSAEVLSFYNLLPFNYFSSAVANVNALYKKNPLKIYKPLHAYLKNSKLRVLDVGCGSGWFVNSLHIHYSIEAEGFDFNPVVLKQAKAAARLAGGSSRFFRADLMNYIPEEKYDVVNSLGVLHHTENLQTAIQKTCAMIKDGGYLHLGLYHKYGREPFLRHFSDMKKRGANEKEMLNEFSRLNPEMQDETQLRSWFRDQVLHPHETLTTLEELKDELKRNGFAIEAASLKNDDCFAVAEKALRKGRFYPGFFTVWAKKQGVS